MAEIRNVTSDGDVVAAESSQPTNPNPRGVLDPPVVDPLETAVQEMMGMDTESEKTRSEEKVKALVNWAKTITDDHSPENIKWVIRDLEFKVGSPGIGEKMIDYLYTYVGLVDQKNTVEKQLKKYNPYGN